MTLIESRFSPAEVRDFLADQLPITMDDHRVDFDNDGVGGRWLVLELIPGVPAAEPDDLWPAGS